MVQSLDRARLALLLLLAAIHGVGLWYHERRQRKAMVFTVLCLSQLGHALAIRSELDSTFSIGFWTNPVLIATVVFTLGLQLATIYVPQLNPIFKTELLDVDRGVLRRRGGEEAGAAGLTGKNRPSAAPGRKARAERPCAGRAEGAYWAGLPPP